MLTKCVLMLKDGVQAVNIAFEINIIKLTVQTVISTFCSVKASKTEKARKLKVLRCAVCFSI